jgi:hypothetical protein
MTLQADSSAEPDGPGKIGPALSHSQARWDEYIAAPSEKPL